MTLSSHPDYVRVRPFAAMFSLAWREWLRFFRQRSRIIGALGQPLLFWLLFGAGLNPMFSAGGMSYREYYFPGTMMLIVLFTAIFATISIIEDRHEGFLQGVLVAPAPRWAAVGGKMLGGAMIAMLQAMLFFLLSLTLGIPWNLVNVTMIVGWLFVTALGLTALGFIIAWVTDSTQGFHALMSLLLLPMWLLSGAFFPVPASAEGGGATALIMHWIMRLNPMTYAMAGLRRLMYAGTTNRIDALMARGDLWLPGMPLCLFVVLAFAVVSFLVAWRVSLRSTSGDLR